MENLLYSLSISALVIAFLYYLIRSSYKYRVAEIFDTYSEERYYEVQCTTPKLPRWHPFDDNSTFKELEPAMKKFEQIKSKQPRFIIKQIA